MKIQLNTDKNILGGERIDSYLTQLIQINLSRFSDQITRIEAHLADQNAQKNGLNDIRCMLEARLENKRPIAVSGHAKTVDKAMNAALNKLKTSLETIDGRLSRY